jgi:heat shock protein HslJ
MRSTEQTWAPILILLLVGFAAGCTPRAEEPQEVSEPATVPAPAPVTITDRDWELVELVERMNPLWPGKRPATMRLDAATSRAMGFAGCNQYSAGYTLSADSLTFQPPVSTKMACAEGMDLEILFLTALPTITTYEATDSTLTLHAKFGPVARFRAP